MHYNKNLNKPIKVNQQLPSELTLEFSCDLLSKTRVNFIEPKTGWLCINYAPSISEFKGNPNKYLEIPNVVYSEIFVISKGRVMTQICKNPNDNDDDWRMPHFYIGYHFEDTSLTEVLKNVKNGSIIEIENTGQYEHIPKDAVIYKIYFILDKQGSTNILRPYMGKFPEPGSDRIIGLPISAYYPQ